MKKTILIGVLTFASLHSFAQTTDQRTSTDTTAKVPVDSTDLYGFISQKPIKVGGGPANQRKYLESLRDPQGKKVSYERTRSCCAYVSSSPGALFGTAMLDVYEITYRDANNKKQKVSVYISFYDYEEPKAIKGFTLE